ncbi:DegT/DnrJ/EryC1/StrS family aminotransferase [Candidatus Woesearchaeota archaeon]|nr:DegT/DnrJ/EryC1/StrS family aminotransferase [Candidatus Woesearchaeota archaeon]
MKKINIAAPKINNFSLFCDRAKDVFESGILTNNGKYLKQLENSLSNYLNVECISVCNATLGLELTLKGLGLKGNVIVPSFTFCATTHAIILAGLTPNFVDIDIKTFNLDPIKVEEAINDQTSAILGVHVFGNPCNIIELEKIAKKHNLKLIFDAAHAFGSTYNQKKIGTFGDAEVFSMHATKTLISGEGGIISSKNKEIINYISTARNFGIINETDTAFAGTNAKMGELHALVGLDSFSEVENDIKKKSVIVDHYKQLLKEVNGILFQEIEENSTCAYFYFSIIIDEKEYGINRDKLAEILSQNGVQARKYFYLPIHKQSAYKEYNSLVLPNSEMISSNILCLPTHIQLMPDEISYICEIIKNAGNEK